MASPGVMRISGWVVLLLASSGSTSPLRSSAALPDFARGPASCASIPNASRIPCGIYETRKDNMHGNFDFGKACEVSAGGSSGAPVATNVGMHGRVTRRVLL
jgi:hypothetical protein